MKPPNKSFFVETEQKHADIESKFYCYAITNKRLTKCFVF